MALAVAIALPACKKAKPARLHEDSFQLGNGLEVDLVSGPCGDGADVALVFAVGADHDPPGRSGLVEVVARAAGRGLTAAADHTALALPASGDRLADELDGVAAWLARPEPGPIDAARTEALAALARRRGGDALETARTFAAESVHPSAGGGWRGGVAGELAAVEPAEAAAFWQAHLRPGVARLVVVGRFDPEVIGARIEASFTPIAAGTAPPPRAPADATVTGVLVMGPAPAAVALAVPAPPPSSPSYAAFLVLAARLPDADYDPIARPDVLLVTAPIAPGAPAEARAAALRDEVAAIVARPLTPADVTAARTRFAAFLGAPAACRTDRRAFALARARRAQLGVDGAALDQALGAVTAAQLAEAAARFDGKHSAAVIAGGPVP